MVLSSAWGALFVPLVGASPETASMLQATHISQFEGTAKSMVATLMDGELSSGKLLALLQHTDRQSIDIAGIIEELQNLVEPALLSANTSDSSLLSGSKATQTACKTARDEGSISQNYGSFTTAQQKHKDCRAAQKAADDARIAENTNYSTWITAKNDGSPDCLLDKSQIQDETAPATFDAWVTRFQEYARIAREHQAAIELATQANTDKADECMLDQKDMEEKYCSWYSVLKAEWNTYDSCRVAIDAPFTAALSDVAARVATRKVQYTQLKNIICVLEGAFANVGTDPSEQTLTDNISECHAKTVDTSAYDQTYPTFEAKEQNPAVDVVEFPGNVAWEAEYFADLAWEADDVVLKTKTTCDAAPFKYGFNRAAPTGFKPKVGAGPCLCAGGGEGMDSCGELCCATSPWTNPDSAGRYSYEAKWGDSKTWEEARCYEPA